MIGNDDSGDNRVGHEHLLCERPALEVLLAEDDRHLREMLAAALRRRGHHVREIADGGQLRSALAGIHREGAAYERNYVVIADLRMPLVDGLTALQESRLLGLGPPFILMSAFADESVLAKAAELDVVAVFDKPFDTQGLCAAVDFFGRRRIARDKSPG